MKATLISRSFLLASMLIALNSFGQRSGYKNETDLKFSSYEIQKALASPVTDVAAGTESINVSKKALTRFSKKFQNASNVKWEQIEDGFLAKFSSGEISTHSLFNKHGKLIYTINFCSEKQLPWYLAKMVNGHYKNYQITSAAEVLMDNRKIWVVKLAGTSNYVAVRIEDDEMQEIENFQKVN